jgi:hypothetical protein
MPGLLGAHHAFRITPASLRRAGRARLRASSSTERPHGGWLIRPLSRVGSSVYRVRSPIDLRLAVTVPPRRFGAERRDDAVDEINSSRASDAQQRADNSAPSSDCKQKDLKMKGIATRRNSPQQGRIRSWRRSRLIRLLRTAGNNEEIERFSGILGQYFRPL